MDRLGGTVGVLTLLVVVPLLGAVAVGVGSRRPAWPRRLALGFSLGTFGLALLVWARFDATVSSYQLVESLPWIPSFGISYLVGLDGVSLLMVLLTTFLAPLSVLASWDSVQEKVSVFYAVLLVMEGFLLGAFLAIDVFLFYMFWEALLVPTSLLIGAWGRRGSSWAAIKFALFAMGGSIFLLAGMLLCYELHNVQAGTPSFDLRTWQGLVMSHSLQRWLFLAFFIGCAVKIPIFPLHAWLPDAQGDAPTAGSVVLAGVFLKLGVYGLLRFAIPLFPEGARTFAPTILTLAVVGILYGTLVAMVQSDVKRLLAYFCLSQLGFVMLGIFSFDVAGVEGAIYQMLNHGITTGALFLLVGMIYQRRKTYALEELGGLQTSTPKLAAVFLIVSLSAIGLPGLNGFVGMLLILLGAFETVPPFAVVATLGVVLSAVCLVRMYRQVILERIDGSTHQPAMGLRDLTGRERAILLPLVIAIVWLGLAPGGFLRVLDGTTEKIIPVAPVGVLEE